MLQPPVSSPPPPPPQVTACAARQSPQSPNCFRIPIPLEPLKDGHSMDPKERTFLEAAERGDRHTMIRCLSPPDPVNVNCTNILGRSAIQIAVDNENVEIVELLLRQPDVQIGDALLQAIREGVYKIVEMLIDHPSITAEMLASGWARSQAQESSDYSADISPVILAAHCNQFEILQLLLSRGAGIERPHALSCSCRRCCEDTRRDSLRHSLRRIHAFRALASPAWMSLTSEDPILTAFKLSWELGRLAQRENEFKEIYLELSNQCKKYSCELLDLCRSSEEVIAVLNKRTSPELLDDSDDEEEVEVAPEEYCMSGGSGPYQMAPRGLTLSRLKMALKYDQKQFVAHPNCQQLLTSIWYQGLPVWRRRNALSKTCLCAGLIMLLPLIACYYLAFPRSRLSRVVRSPFMKFIYHSASFGCFLLLLILASTGTDRARQNIRGPAPSPVEWLILFWVTGMVWAECKQLWEEGLKAYVCQWWNWLDFIMLSLYLTTGSLRAVAYFQVQSGQYGARVLDRVQWPANDPTLISEGVFAMANVFSFARIIYLFQTNPHLGPLQISLGCMIVDIAKFLFIFFLVLTSFVCGLNQLYWYYDPTMGFCETKEVGGVNITFNCHHNPDAFLTIDASYTSLLWSLFGVIPIKDISARKDQPFTKWVGHALLGAYMIMAMTVMINMLIAMMSRSFQDIEDHKDREWKFARSKLWMGYFDEGSTLPPPFNLIISPKSVWYFLRGLLRLGRFLCKSAFAARPRFQHSAVKPETHDPVYIGNTLDKTNRKPGARRNTVILQFNGQSSTVQYQEVMKRLVNRYIHRAKKQLRQDGVNEDDLLEIKQDISSLRFELREDRKREAAHNVRQLDTLRRDIFKGVPPGARPEVLAAHLQPPAHASLQQPAAPSPYYGLLSPEEVEQLRMQVIEGVREELRRLARELHVQHCHRGPAFPAPARAPSLPPDLYQTHLFTQL
ncbi:transient-receptor-potential-like protein [Dermacentor silvarum]|uniref:transient-receptor-potential-like protein n=1 Tax=Dermacentor silvarum TaxID=543639 RepID=UPI001896D2B1|nr:transient-receptor-potential-like protein [Dermacentor silvarum]